MMMHQTPHMVLNYDDILRKCWPEIRLKVDALCLLPHLTKFTKSECQAIDCKHKSEGQERGADILIDTLGRRTDCFLTFIVALENNNYDTLVANLCSYLSEDDVKLLDEERIRIRKTVRVSPQEQQPQNVQQNTDNEARFNNAPQREISPYPGNISQSPDNLTTDVRTNSDSLRCQVQEDPLVSLLESADTGPAQTGAFDDIPNPIFEKLAEELNSLQDENGVKIPIWKKVANKLKLTRGVVREIDTSENPGEKLLDHLNDIKCSVDKFSDVLKELNLHNTASILKGDEPSSQTVGCSDDNFDDKGPGDQKILSKPEPQEVAAQFIMNKSRQERGIMETKPPNVKTGDLAYNLVQCPPADDMAGKSSDSKELNISPSDEPSSQTVGCSDDNNFDDKGPGDQKILSKPEHQEVAAQFIMNKSRQERGIMETKPPNVKTGDLAYNLVQCPPADDMAGKSSDSNELNIPPSGSWKKAGKVPIEKSGYNIDQESSDPYGTFSTKSANIEADMLHSDASKQLNISKEFRCLHGDRSSIEEGKSANTNMEDNTSVNI